MLTYVKFTEDSPSLLNGQSGRESPLYDRCMRTGARASQVDVYAVTVSAARNLFHLTRSRISDRPKWAWSVHSGGRWIVW